MTITMLLLLACSSDPAAAPPDAEPAEAASPADASSRSAKGDDQAAASTETVTLDLCGNPYELALTAPGPSTSDPSVYRLVPGEQAGMLRGGQPVTVDQLRGYGWVGEASSDGRLTWYDLPANLSPAEVVERIQPSYHCEGLGGDGAVQVTGGVATAVTVLDDRFKTDGGVGVGADIDTARSWLCATTCEETEMMIGPELIISTDGVSAAFVQNKVWQLTIELDGGAGAATGTARRKQRDRNTGKAGRGGKVKAGR